MHLLQPCDDLVEKAASLWLWNATFCNNVIKEFSTARVFHDEIQLAASFNDFIELDNVRVPDQFQDVDLTSDTFYISNFQDTLFLQNLDGYSLACQNMGPQFDLAKGALADGFA